MSDLVSQLMRSWTDLMDWLYGMFFQQEMDLSILGLPAAGKTTLVTLISRNEMIEDRIPTRGLNMQKYSKGGVTLKMWDLGGQANFRAMWERYCVGASAIVYVVDAADSEKFELSRSELHDLLSKPSLAGIPLLLLGNKNDLPAAVNSEKELAEIFDLASLKGREVCAYSISAKNRTNIDITLQWLIAHSSKKS
uniref:Uncharacterized protein n=2 Tax=Rhodosorus marinus TaxID=101924 RepID=A0A7S3E9S2_9RHOD|mmetsp:Transcript_19518/g.77806  ORF Transcript_19518/g.77806 Transcript_19518/m.77806 type:complete len:194 (+) Transcript_19518:143-724(+)|eukprot:CAMPEP_0113960200 /NCGR_PEP_ID=MMETSP0011_2-20120614/4579_1 /TAXON_ID=101924 /ORGANISM="Rhodosorus marinus" /LENGTH=193 /DNA_ID=CAMNT_0000971619 /DNA_START=89 /DNA_END=670 /DNA_ORIENTATION=+ /assembly_acc=CAM_ASM_000156